MSNSYWRLATISVITFIAAGCQQATTDRIIGTAFFADFEAQLNYHNLAVMPKPVPVSGPLGIVMTRMPSTKPSEALSNYFTAKESTPVGPADTIKSYRNSIVNALISLDEQDFQAYTGDIGHVQRSSAVVDDIVVLALTGAATVTGGTEAKSILAGLAAVFTGTKIAVDKDIFFENTFPAIVNQMKVLRDQQRLLIQQKLASLDDSTYPLEAAFYDVLALYRYGTITGAIASLSQATVAANNTVKAALPTTADATQFATSIQQGPPISVGSWNFTVSQASWDTTTGNVSVTLVAPTGAGAPKTDDVKKNDLLLKTQVGLMVRLAASQISAASVATVTISNLAALEGTAATQPATDQSGAATPAPAPKPDKTTATKKAASPGASPTPNQTPTTANATQPSTNQTNP